MKRNMFQRHQVNKKSKLFNLKKLLTRAKYLNKKDHYSKKFTEPKCTCCNFIKEGKFYTFKTTGDTFYFKEDMPC